MFKDRVEGGAETVIASGVKVEGDFVSPGNVRIEGLVKGSVKADGDLFISETASIEADVKSANAVISGDVRGNVTVGEKLELTGTAKLHGDLSAKVLTVAAGAVIEGRCQVSPEGARENVTARNRQPKVAAVEEA